MNNNSIKILNDLFQNHPELKVCGESIINSCEVLVKSFLKKGKMVVCGNGGSAADAEHISGELIKSFRCKRTLDTLLKEKINDASISNDLQKGLPVIPLCSLTAFLSAFNNDNNPDNVYAQGVVSFCQKDDVLFCITTSGNSKNCVNAAKVARALGNKVISLTGSKFGQIDMFSNISIKVPSEETYLIQELHLPVYHCICAIVENEIFGE